jgi:hypothetical protein
MLEKRNLLQQMVLGKLDIHRYKPNPCLSPYKKIGPKWVRNLDARPETWKLLQENIGKILEDTSIGNSFLNRSPIAQDVRTKDKWDCIRLKSFCTSKATISRMKRQRQNERKSLSAIHQRIYIQNI